MARRFFRIRRFGTFFGKFYARKSTCLYAHNRWMKELLRWIAWLREPRLEIIDPNPRQLGKVRNDDSKTLAYRHARRVCLPANWNRYSITADSRASLDTFETQSNFISTVSICVPLAPRVHRTLLPSVIALFINAAVA